VTDPTATLFVQRGHANWVRLQTLMTLRWIAIAGQILAILVAVKAYDLQLEIGLCFVAIGLAAIANLVALFVYPKNKRMTETEVAGILLFDIVQLSWLLALTGGLHNPFALLILVPVTISATALRWQTTAALGAVAIVLVTVVTLWHVPLHTQDGTLMRMPPVFVKGFWLAIVLGAVFLPVFAQRVTSEVHAMADALAATQMALAREQKLTDLGGVVAAAAHELGTPLATIKLVSSELAAELEGDHREDAILIRDQADRCSEILRSMGRAGNEDLHIRNVPLEAVLREAAEPHASRGREIVYGLPEGKRQPTIIRRPEIVHGLRNLIQNAVDFSSELVRIDADWDDRRITVRIADDGPGFPASVIDRLGDPFVRRRRIEDDRAARPLYEGMGLGLFIAKTLLERTGADVAFVNARDAKPPGEPWLGAIVLVSWPWEVISPEQNQGREPLGRNRPIEA
jgi:two-component system sensor histidine kinase RegB